MFPELWKIEFVCSLFLFVSLVPKDKDYEQLEADPTLYPIPRLGKIVVNSFIPIDSIIMDTKQERTTFQSANKIMWLFTFK